MPLHLTPTTGHLDEPGTYGPDGVLYRGEWVREQPRNDEWRRENLRHVAGRYQI